MSEISREERHVTRGRVKGRCCLLHTPAELAGWITLCICPSLLLSVMGLPTTHTNPGETKRKCGMTPPQTKTEEKERDRLDTGICPAHCPLVTVSRGAFQHWNRFSGLDENLRSKTDEP